MIYSYRGHLLLVFDIHRIFSVAQVLEIDVVKPVSFSSKKQVAQFYRWMYQCNSFTTDTPNWLTKLILTVCLPEYVNVWHLYGMGQL